MSKGKFHEFEEFPCSFRLKNPFKQCQLLLFVCVRREHTTNELLHRITREKDVILLLFSPPCDNLFNVLMLSLIHI